jgi:tRNA synthetases class I (E and Q), anti-codon binding domain
LVGLVDFDLLITKDKFEEGDELEDFLTARTEIKVDAFADCNFAEVKAGDIIQFERKGFYRCDRAIGRRLFSSTFQQGRGNKHRHTPSSHQDIRRGFIRTYPCFIMSIKPNSLTDLV